MKEQIEQILMDNIGAFRQKDSVRISGISSAAERIEKIFEEENEKLVEAVTEFLEAFKSKYPVAFVGDPSSKEERLYLAYHKVKQVLEKSK